MPYGAPPATTSAPAVSPMIGAQRRPRALAAGASWLLSRESTSRMSSPSSAMPDPPSMRECGLLDHGATRRPPGPREPEEHQQAAQDGTEGPRQVDDPGVHLE